MPSGEFKVTDIPTLAEVEEVKQGFLDSVKTGDPPPEITVEGDGPWTVIAKFPETDTAGD